MSDGVNVNYQGRKASRSRSEQRRKAILEAALRLVVKEGVRGVRHRAVAKEADVPLSATTYYFKDISDLITDTFTLFAEKAMSDVVTPIYTEVEAFIQANGGKVPEAGPIRNQLVEALATLLVAFIQHELTEKRDHLLAEQAFMHESLRDPRLRDMAQHYYGYLVNDMHLLCEKMGIDEPDIVAELLMATIFRLEQEGLQCPSEEFDADRAKRMLKRIFHTFLVQI